MNNYGARIDLILLAEPRRAAAVPGRAAAEPGRAAAEPIAAAEARSATAEPGRALAAHSILGQHAEAQLQASNVASPVIPQTAPNHHL